MFITAVLLWSRNLPLYTAAVLISAASPKTLKSGQLRLNSVEISSQDLNMVTRWRPTGTSSESEYEGLKKKKSQTSSRVTGSGGRKIFSTACQEGAEESRDSSGLQQNKQPWSVTGDGQEGLGLWKAASPGFRLSPAYFIHFLFVLKKIKLLMI